MRNPCLLQSASSFRKLTLGILFACLISHAVTAQDGNDHTEAAYITAIDQQGTVMNVPLKSVKADVRIAGCIADVSTRQTYTNPSDQEIQATYVFPGSTRAAVYAMTMDINGVLTNAEIQEKQAAQKAFDAAVTLGKSASLLQQHRPNIFQMDLGNMPPHSTVIIELKYTELITPVDGIYEFVYPTIVGKRYDQEDQTGETWTLNPYAKLDQGVPQTAAPAFNIQVTLKTPVPLRGVTVTQHQSSIDYPDARTATIRLNNEDRMENKDFILHYRLQGDQIETGLMLWEGEDENFFLYLGESPKRISQKQIPPRTYLFIVDVSGSMQGFPLDLSRTLIRQLLTGLRPQDQFNVLLFASSSATLFEQPEPATSANIQQALSFTDQQEAAGGTQLLDALHTAFQHISAESSTSFVILTDGFVTVEKEAFDFIQKNLGQANFFPFGIGGSVNRYLIEGLAHVGHSEPFIVTRPEEAAVISQRFHEYISNPVLTNIHLSFSEFEAYDIIPQSFPDLFAEKPLVVMGKWKGKPKGTIQLTGQSGSGAHESTIHVAKKLIDEDHAPLKYLWARKKLQLLSDYNNLTPGEANQEAITALGLKYSLLSEFTSFVAISENESEASSSGVVAYPSGNAGAVPEPHEWALILLSAAFVLVIFLKSHLGQ